MDLNGGDEIKIELHAPLLDNNNEGDDFENKNTEDSSPLIISDTVVPKYGQIIVPESREIK